MGLKATFVTYTHHTSTNDTYKNESGFYQTTHINCIEIFTTGEVYNYNGECMYILNKTETENIKILCKKVQREYTQLINFIGPKESHYNKPYYESLNIFFPTALEICCNTYPLQSKSYVQLMNILTSLISEKDAYKKCA